MDQMVVEQKDPACDCKPSHRVKQPSRDEFESPGIRGGCNQQKVAEDEADR